MIHMLPLNLLIYVKVEIIQHTGNWTQGFVNARQVFYHGATSLSLLNFIWDQGLMSFPGWPWTSDGISSTFLVGGIAGVHPYAWSEYISVARTLNYSLLFQEFNLSTKITGYSLLEVVGSLFFLHWMK